MIVGGYSLDLYCDHPEHDQWYRLKRGNTGSCDAQIFGETYGGCAQQARRRGWMLSRDGMRCLCPEHSGKRPKRAAIAAAADAMGAAGTKKPARSDPAGSD